MPPSMILDLNKSILKIWKFEKNYNITVPVPKILSTDFNGNFFKLIGNIGKKNINSACVNIYLSIS